MQIVKSFKKAFYFPIAYYFRFFAKIRLKKWNPQIIVITGSSGKTSLLSLIESQLGNKAKYSHHANSAFGIPFNILGLERKKFSKLEWILFFIKAPFLAFAKSFTENLYIVEADCDRPNEGEFLSTLLKPEVVLWISSSRTHSMNYVNKLDANEYNNVEKVIAYEYGYFIENATGIVITNGDSDLINNELKRTNVKIIKVVKDEMRDYQLLDTNTVFRTNRKDYYLNCISPKDLFYSIRMTEILMNYLNLPFDNHFSQFIPPPGRSSILRGIKNTTIIDSTYNNNLLAATIMLQVLSDYPKKPKWLVIGDMLEQGIYEKEEHEKLGILIASYKNAFDKIILIGQAVTKYTYPKLKNLDKKVEKFLAPNEVLNFLKKNIQGKEVILFKGAGGRLLEGIVEQLLADKSDAKKLARRGQHWQHKRQKIGL